MTQSYNDNANWYKINNEADVNSPALLIYPGRIEKNILKMISIAGDACRLRPHVKTHKMEDIVRLQMEKGINRFKCSTIAEAEMVALCGAPDIMLAYQPVGPNIERFFRLTRTFPDIKFSCITDSEEIIRHLSELALLNSVETHVWLDINNGMNRTGVPPGNNALKLYKLILELPMLKAEGLHVYDGHITKSDLNLRIKICNDAFEPVNTLINELKKDGADSVPVIAGGTPTFPIHAGRRGTETSPGTTLLWDYNYSNSLIDMDFLYGAILMTRIVSKPEKNVICIDLGHKAVASEMPHPRIMIQEFKEFSVLTHSEEHMVIKSDEAEKMRPGDVLYAIPFHICPTVDRYDKVSVVRSGMVTEEWSVNARKRKISI